MNRPYPSNKQRPFRRGSVTALSALIGGLIGFTILVGLGFYLILSHQQRGQAACDQLSMSIAKSLNAGDRVGQLNAVIEHSRELVYLSRENANLAAGLGVPSYQQLAAQLLNEAREAPNIVDKERDNQIKLAVTETQKAIKAAREGEEKSSGVYVLPFVLETRPQINQVYLGYIKDTLSSVESPAVLDELQKNDLKNNYIEPTSKLFRGNINAKLPTPDEDLPFHFASLPAEVKHIDSPPRMVNASVFQSTGTVFDRDPNAKLQKPADLPSAAQVAGSIGVKAGEKTPTELNLKCVSSATANSALQAP
jgi:hypothetical protein